MAFLNHRSRESKAGDCLLPLSMTLLFEAAPVLLCSEGPGVLGAVSGQRGAWQSPCSLDSLRGTDSHTRLTPLLHCSEESSGSLRSTELATD